MDGVSTYIPHAVSVTTGEGLPEAIRRPNLAEKTGPIMRPLQKGITMMTKLELTKTVVNVIVGAGASKVTADIIKNNTNPENVKDIVTTTSASFVMGMMVADATKEYTNTKIDELTGWWKANVTGRQK